MSLFTRAEALEFLTEAKAAYKAVISGKSYEIKDRRLTRQNSAELERLMNKWQRYVNDIDAGLNPDGNRQIRRVDYIG